MGLSHALALVLLATLLPVQSASSKNLATLLSSVSNEAKKLQIERQPHPDKVFVFMNQNLTWYRARRYCEESGMNLATIRSEEEQKTMEQLLQKRGLTKEDLWLGGHDLWDTRNEVWSWRIDSRDEPFTYTNWDDGEPNDVNINQRCLQIRPAFGYRWDNVACSDFQRFVCENKCSVSYKAVLTISNPE